MALPSVVSYLTVTVLPLGADKVTVKVALTEPVSPSTTDVSAMLSAGGPSSSWMVPTPWPSEMIALVALLRVTVKVSSGSSVVSSFTVTVMNFWVSPGLKVSVPLIGV